MKIGRLMAVERHLGPLFEGQSVAGLGERQLLERFVERRDEPAFAALVARHGPMVLGVCRRLLADPLDVEDAFQATFLVLVRRAGSLKDRDRLASWLFGVARKVATRARVDLARRKAREGPGVEEVAAEAGRDDSTRELRRALVEEIDRLPGSLREPVLLCCVEGLSYDEAANRLQSTAPAIRGRLARARARLRDRLTRRGFAPSAGSLGVLLTFEMASAAVPSRLLLTTIQVAKAGAVPAIVEILAEGVIRSMILTKSKILAAALVACGVAGSSVGLNAQMSPAVPPTTVPPAEADRLDQVEKKLDRVLEALDAKSKWPTYPPSRVMPAPAGNFRWSPTERDPDEPPNPSQPLPPAVPAPPPAAAVPGVPPTPPPPPKQSAGPMSKKELEARPSKNIAALNSEMVSPPASDRLVSLERKLQALEARLDKLERRIDADDRSDVVLPPPADGFRLPIRNRSGNAPRAEPERDPENLAIPK